MGETGYQIDIDDFINFIFGKKKEEKKPMEEKTLTFSVCGKENIYTYKISRGLFH